MNRGGCGRRVRNAALPDIYTVDAPSSPRWTVQRRRPHRSFHPVHAARWTGRAACAAAVVGVVVLALWRPAPHVQVQAAAPAQDQRVCALVEVVVALGLDDLPPPLNATPEDLAAVARVNALLAQRRSTIMGLSGLQEMGC